jgi:chorismate mutase
MDDPVKALAQLRIEIDAIDDEISALLALRFSKTDALGVYKAMVGEAAEDPLRQLQRAHVLQDMANRHRLPLGLVLDVFGKIKVEVVSRHRARGAA